MQSKSMEMKYLPPISVGKTENGTGSTPNSAGSAKGNTVGVAISGDEDGLEEPEEPRISCCYGFMVFLGLTISLLGLTLLVIYAGFWSNYALQGNASMFMGIGSNSFSTIEDLYHVSTVNTFFCRSQCAIISHG